MITIKGKVIRVVDGDTIDLLLDMGFDVWKRERVRLGPNFDAWESRHKDAEHKVKGLAAKEFVEDCLGDCYVSHAIWGRGPVVNFLSKEYDRGKYGRAIGDIEFLDWNGNVKSLINELRKNNHEKKDESENVS